LPQTITTSEGTITYTYDAAGNKLRKQIVQTPAITIPSILVNNTILPNQSTLITTTINYVDGFEYKTVNYSAATLAPLNNPNTDVLQFIVSEEGRIRFKPAIGNVPASFVHDYFERDHLGNVRVGITDETTVDTYPAATGESTGTGGNPQTYEAQYYSFSPGDIIPVSNLGAWYTSMINGSGSGHYPIINENSTNGMPANNDPYSNTGSASQNVFQLCGNTASNASGHNFTLGVTLKVMAGDNIQILGTSFWHNTASSLPSGGYPVSAPTVLTNLLGAFAGSAAVASTINHSVLDGIPLNAAAAGPTGSLVSPLLNNSYNQSSNGYSNAPYAGINYIIFDDQFQPQMVGIDLVQTSTDLEKPHNFSVSIPKNGYIYVFVSNQSNINVYFDNLQLVQTHGQMLEEAHYYPSGLLMAGISDRAWNKQPNYYHYQGKEMQNEEWYDGTGLEEYDFGARFYDQQLGRWNTQDPAGQFVSPYNGMGNNWPNGVDPNGKWGWDNVVVAAIGFAVGYAEYGIAQHHWGWKAVESGGISAGEAELAYIGLGGGGYVDYGNSSGFLGGASFGTNGATVGISSSAIPFSVSYAATSAFTYAQNYKQISSASANGEIGLLAGYNGTSAITAGFNSNNAQNWVDGWFKGAPFASTVFSGALSQGIGGAISSAGNNILTNGGGWTSSTGFSAFSGFVSSYAGQVAHNAVGDIPGIKNLENKSWNFWSYIKNAVASSAQNIASGVTQQFIGNSINQIGSQNGYNVAPSYLGQYIDGNTWWGSYINGLGGYQSDIIGFH
jgi:RHS repeat-associated protein